MLNERKRVREKEIKLVLNEIKRYPNANLLEVGCGSGFQASILQKDLEFFIPSDVTYERLSRSAIKLKNFIKCSGEYLPFKRNVFGIVYMSQVLEHIKNKRNALKEMKRVLNNESGTLIVVVPTSFWKVLSVLTYYLNSLYFYLPKFIFSDCWRYVSLKRFGSRFCADYKQRKSDSRRRISIYLLPKPHGEYQSNLEEFMAYKEHSWVHLIQSSGFEVFKIEHLFTHIPKCFILLPYFSSKKLALSSSLIIVSKKLSSKRK